MNLMWLQNSLYTLMHYTSLSGVTIRLFLFRVCGESGENVVGWSMEHEGTKFWYKYVLLKTSPNKFWKLQLFNMYRNLLQAKNGLHTYIGIYENSNNFVAASHWVTVSMCCGVTLLIPFRASCDALLSSVENRSGCVCERERVKGRGRGGEGRGGEGRGRRRKGEGKGGNEKKEGAGDGRTLPHILSA